MSEDSGFIRNKPQKKKEGEYAPDFCGSLGKGMLATEALRNTPGLTPLHIVNEPQMNADERRCCCVGIGKMHEETEKLRHLSGLSVPLSLRGEFHKRGVI